MAIVVNGRFLGQSVTGVQRFAIEVVRAWDRALADGTLPRPEAPVEVLVPPGTTVAHRYSCLVVREVGRRQGHAWEQLDLPRAVRGRLLVSLGNTGPLVLRRQLVVIHDAAVFGAPGAYSRAFVAWYRFVYRVLLARARDVVTVSAFSRTELLRHTAAHREIGVVHESGEHMLSVDHDASILERLGVPGRRFVLAVSSLNPNKNFGVVVRASQRLRRDDLVFAVAGGANPRVFAGAQTLPESVVHLGYVTDAQLRSLYEAAACFVFPSKYEGFGLPPVEAMALGCPVVAARAASMPEVLGEAASYFDPDDADGLAARIAELVDHAETSDRMRDRGRTRSAQLTWEKCAATLWQRAVAAAGSVA